MFSAQTHTGQNVLKHTHLHNPLHETQPEIDLVCEETSFRLRCFTTNRWTVFKVQRSDSHLDNVCIYLLNWFLISCVIIPEYEFISESPVKRATSLKQPQVFVQ